MSKTLNHIYEHSIPKKLNISWEEFHDIHHTEPITSVRMNPLKQTTQFESEEKVPWSEHGYYLKNRPNFTADPLLHAGAYYVQEASSMFLEFALKQLVDFNKQLTALDLCAAPGGKTTLLSSLLSEDSLLIANEVIATRVNILNENVTKWGNINTWISNSDALHFGKLFNHFDLMIVDAPCSGSGLFRRIPGYLDEWTQDNVNLCVQRQKRILHDSYPCIAQDGILIYMTCSFSQEENEEMVDYILGNFDVESCNLPLNEKWNIVETESEIHKGKGYRFFPHKLKGEGFFLACFKKKDGSMKDIPYEKNKNKLAIESEVLTNYIDMNGIVAINQNSNILLMQENHVPYYNALTSQLKLIKKGILAGQIIRNELIPDHELAMYSKIKKGIKSIELTLNEAILYLKKENIILNDSPKGWLLVQYQQQNLGWVKNIGNRVNNYYPSNYRILNKNILPSK